MRGAQSLWVWGWLTAHLTLPGLLQIPQPQKGSISGTVVDSQKGTPVDGAAVRFVCRLANAEQFAISAETDVGGRFQLTGLPACAATLAALKQGYVTSFWGQPDPGLGVGRPLALAAGEHRTNVTLAIAPGAVIAGQVVSPAGNPIGGARIDAIGLTTASSSSAPGLERFGQALSNDHGVFRVFGLPGGEYVLRILLPKAAVDRASSATSTLDCSRSPMSNDPPVYFPGSPTLSGAVKIRLAVSQEYSIGTLAVPRFENQVLRGRATVSAGIHRGTALLVDGDTCIASTSIAPDGSFSFGPVPRGLYRLELRAFAAPVLPPNVTSDYNVDRSGGVSWAARDVILADAPAVVTVPLETGYRVRGRAVSEPVGQKWDPLVRAGAPIITLTSELAAGSPRSEITAPVRADGSFEFSSIPAGRYRIRSNAAPTYGFLASAITGGRDALDFGFEVSSDIGDLTVLFATTTTVVRGQLGTAASEPGRVVPPCYAVIYPKDRQLWSSLARRIVGVQADDTGSFSVRNLPAGDYSIAAVVGPAPASWREVLDDLTPTTSIRLTRGVPATVSLQCR